jgi:hypothetical protein
MVRDCKTGEVTIRRRVRQWGAGQARGMRCRASSTAEFNCRVQLQRPAEALQAVAVQVGRGVRTLQAMQPTASCAPQECMHAPAPHVIGIQQQAQLLTPKLNTQLPHT